MRAYDVSTTTTTTNLPLLWGTFDAARDRLDFLGWTSGYRIVFDDDLGGYKVLDSYGVPVVSDDLAPWND